MTAEARRVPIRRVSLAQLALLVPWVALVLGALRPITDNSFLWHVRAGSLQTDLGSVLTSDPFSFTMRGEPWRTQSWLADLLYANLEQSFGLGFVGPMMLALGVLTFLTVGILAFRLSRSVAVTAGVVLITTFLFAPVMVPRPVVFSFPIFALVILAWEDKRLRWALPFLVWLWASLHGSFFLAGVYMVLRAVSTKEFKSSVAPVLASGAAGLLTAHGLGIVTILTDFVTARPYLALMQEWRTPDFLTAALAPFLLAITWILFLAVGGRLERRDLWIVIPFLILALSASRAVFTGWLALVPVVAWRARGSTWKLGTGFPLPVATVAAIAIVVAPLLLSRPVALDEERFPVAAASHLHDVRTFHDDLTGGYMIYSETLADGVFIDDRAELYRERLAEMVRVRSGAEPWREVFEGDGIEQALVSATGPLVELLQASGWSVVYRDSVFAVLRP